MRRAGRPRHLLARLTLSTTPRNRVFRIVCRVGGRARRQCAGSQHWRFIILPCIAKFFIFCIAGARRPLLQFGTFIFCNAAHRGDLSGASRQLWIQLFARRPNLATTDNGAIIGHAAPELPGMMLVRSRARHTPTRDSRFARHDNSLKAEIAIRVPNPRKRGTRGGEIHAIQNRDSN